MAGGQPCAWGQSPSFLDWSVPAAGAPLVGREVTTTLAISGWAVGERATPTAVSIVGADGVELGRAGVMGSRPDVAAATGSTGVFSGFAIVVGLAAGEDPSTLRIVVEDGEGARHGGPLGEGATSSGNGLTYHVDAVTAATVGDDADSPSGVAPADRTTAGVARARCRRPRR